MSLELHQAAQTLYPYQQKWLTDPARFKIAMMSRQIGKTFTTTLEIALDLLTAELNNERVRWVILSRGERQAREAMEEGVKFHLQHLIAYVRQQGEFDLSRIISMKALEVEMQHGSRVTALPANPDTARGFSANVFLDEFAFHQDSRAIWRALYPVVSKPGLKMRIVSTPNGKNNKFYDLMSGVDTIWSRHKVDIYQAVREGLPRDVEELKTACGDEDMWRQEYELQWLDEASAWLPLDLINACEDAQAGRPELYSGGTCFVGVDIGRRHDLFVIWVLEQVEDVFWTREIIERKGATFSEQDALLAEVFNKYRIRLCRMDQTGIGEKPVEDAKLIHGENVVEGVVFSVTRKLDLAQAGKALFEDGRIKIPAGNADLRADLHKLKKTVGATGLIRFTAESDSAGHADRAWACFLAASACLLPHKEYAYTPVRTYSAYAKHRLKMQADWDDDDSQRKGAW